MNADPLNRGIVLPAFVEWLQLLAFHRNIRVTRHAGFSRWNCGVLCLFDRLVAVSTIHSHLTSMQARD